MFEVDFHILNQKATPAIYADTLALRPAAGFAGRLFIATDSPYGVFRDTGSSWVQIASNGGGGGSSTGVNGLNGTTNIGLGGTLANNTLIVGNNKSFSFQDTSLYITGSSDINSQSYLQHSPSATTILTENKLNTNSAQLYVQYNLINSIFNGSAYYGLSLDDSTGKFVLGDYGNDRKYNSIVVNDSTSEFYFTTSFNQSNTAQDLFYASNASSSNRFVKIGDFNEYQNGVSLIIDDANNQFYTNSLISGTAGIEFNFGSENYRFGANNALIECDNSGQSIKLNTNNLLLSGTITTNTPPGINPLYLNVNVNGIDYRILMNRV
jgi:hypothetical protein